MSDKVTLNSNQAWGMDNEIKDKLLEILFVLSLVKC